MAFYKSPLRPIDPINPAQGTPESIRYVRDNFAGTGQDSFNNPPAQDQGQWQKLENVMPITNGTLTPRWGSQLVAGMSVDTPLVVQEDLLGWFLLPFALRTTSHLKGNAESKYFWLDADAQKFWIIKGSTGNPWDIKLYDTQYLYWWITENGTQNAFTNPSAYKRYNTNHPAYPTPQGVPIAPRFFTPGSTITIDTPGPNPIQRTLNCGADGQAPIDIKDIRGVTQGPITIDFQGDVGVQPCIIINYYYGGSGGIYPSRERYYLVKGWGMVQWDVSSLSGGQYNVSQTSTFNTLLAGGSPTPNFPCYPQSWWIGGAPGAGGNAPDLGTFATTAAFGSPLVSPAAPHTTGSYIGHLYSYQRDTDNLRAIVAPAAGDSILGGSIFKEDGTFYNMLVTRVNAGDPAYRMINSRNFAYFFNGITRLKWDGSPQVTAGVPAGFTGWGIDVGFTSGASTAAKAPGTVAAIGNGTPWSSATLNNIKVRDNVYTTVGNSVAFASNQLLLNNFNMAASGQVVGIQAHIVGGFTSTSTAPKTIRPSSGSASGNGIFSAFANAWDGNVNTYCSVSASPTAPSATVSESVTFAGFPSIGSPTPATLSLSVTCGGDNGADPGGTSGTGSVSYSLNGGSTWTTLMSYATNQTAAKATHTIPLAATQNTTQIQVRQTATAHNGSKITGNTSFSTTQVYEISVSATYPTASGSAQLYVNLVKNGLTYGQQKTVTMNPFLGTDMFFGGAVDTWGGSWTSTDVNASNFGLAIVVGGTGNTTVQLDFASIQVFLKGGGVVISSTASAGSVNLVAGRTYYVSAKNSQTGHYSDLSLASASTGALVNKQISLTLPIFTDGQVDTKAVLATADGNDPSILYLVSEVSNAATTLVDNTPDTNIVLNQVMLVTDDLGNEIGVSNNVPPPSGGSLAIKHKGRLWMAVGQNLYFSKSVADLTLPNGFIAGKYEEAWPASNYFDISPGAENIRGLLSDGSTLFIGTERHIRQLFGDSPDNFQQPEIIHQEAGLLNQDVWQPVYVEGSPSGAIWLTPDNRVIGSDFNAYADIGHNIQDVLNTINVAAAQSVAHAMFVSSGPFDLYILAIPTGSNIVCDTHCVFDLRTKQWFVWQPTDPSTAMLFNVPQTGVSQWLYATVYEVVTNTLGIFQYTSVSPADRLAVAGVTPIAFPVSAMTSWLHLGSPVQRKLLNELDIVGDPSLTVSVYGASTQAEFANPDTLVLDAPMVQDALGFTKVFLAATASKQRYYQFIFNSGGVEDFLDAYTIHAIPQVSP